MERHFLSTYCLWREKLVGSAISYIFIVFIQSEVGRVSQQSHGVNQTGNYTLSLRTHLIAGLK